MDTLHLLAIEAKRKRETAQPDVSAPPEPAPAPDGDDDEEEEEEEMGPSEPKRAKRLIVRANDEAVSAMLRGVEFDFDPNMTELITHGLPLPSLFQGYVDPLKRTTSIVSLYMIRIDGSNFIDIAPGLLANRSITKLDLDHVLDMSAEFANSLAMLLTTTRILKNFYVHWGQIPLSNPHLPTVARALANNVTLEALKWIFYETAEGGDDLVWILAESLEAHPTLTTLLLSTGSLGDAVAQAIASLLELNPTIREVELDSNRIGPAGATALANALRRNTTLRHLSLLANRIGDEGALAMAEMLRINKTLRRLNLRMNRISLDGAEPLKEVLRSHNVTLEHLGLGRQTEFGKDFAEDTQRELRAYDRAERKAMRKARLEILLAHRLDPASPFYGLPLEMITEILQHQGARVRRHPLTIDAQRLPDNVLAIEAKRKRRQPVTPPGPGDTDEEEEDEEEEDMGPSDPKRVRTGAEPVLATTVDEVLGALKTETPFELAPELTDLRIPEDVFGVVDRGKTLGRLLRFLRTNTTVVSLDLSGDPVRPKDVAKLLEANHTLRRLVANGSLRRSPQAEILVFSALAKNAGLQELVLRNNEFGHVGLREAAQALTANKTLLRLDLSYNHLNDMNAEELAGALTVNTTLRCLILDSNEIRNQGMIAMANMLKVNRTLECLQLGLDWKTGTFILAVFQALAEALAQNTSLLRLGLDRIRIRSDDGTMSALVVGLRENTTLRELALRHNDIYSSGLKLLVGTLQLGRPPLVKLSLRNNGIIDGGTIELFRALISGPLASTLTELDLRDNSIGDLIEPDLVALLTANRTLQRLDLRQNILTSTVLTPALRQALEQNTTLRYLGLTQRGAWMYISKLRKHMAAYDRRAQAKSNAAYLRAMTFLYGQSPEGTPLAALPNEVRRMIVDRLEHRARRTPLVIERRLPDPPLPLHP